MRFVLLVIVATVALAAGYFAFIVKAPPAPLPAAPAVEGRVFASTCPVENARYALKGAPAVTLALEVPMARPDMRAVPGRAFVFTESIATVYAVEAGGRTFRFIAVQSTGYTTPYLFPLATDGRVSMRHDGDLIAVSFFGPQFDLLPGLPRRGFAAPEHIFAPGVARYISQQPGPAPIEIAMDTFDFVSCAPDVKLQPGHNAPSGYTPPHPL